MGSTVARCWSHKDKRLIIVCIPKAGKVFFNEKLARPITLLNTVYKIASSCIAATARLITVLPKLNGDDQKGFLKGRYIYTGGNIGLLYDTFLYAKQHQIPGLLLMVDFEKAFDSVTWSFIEKYLRKFKFEKEITWWILIFYTSINSLIHVCMWMNNILSGLMWKEVHCLLIYFLFVQKC